MLILFVVKSLELVAFPPEILLSLLPECFLLFQTLTVVSQSVEFLLKILLFGLDDFADVVLVMYFVQDALTVQHTFKKITSKSLQL